MTRERQRHPDLLEPVPAAAELLSPAGLADLLDFPESAVRWWLSEGMLPAPTEVQGEPYWDRAEIERWLEAGDEAEEGGS